ncbi:FKBP-type peptidyl-prolyl cis-trans isomerase [Serinicoccus kebangsaanensis]|uniref:FKBP-type peptidyl-prolyl cis-trans isomerase n=1 Tax=Serinicoccus kebangsaanensis TaxID=2602069 RepID=UPI00124D55D2|nr:FKBP-type peptidyl-prolyl cis-trans isomerase [Serinicoccus kebangsaanensis]
MRSPRLRYLAAAAAPLIFLAGCSPESSGDGDDAAATSAPGDDAATSAPPNGDLADIAVDTEGDEPALTWDDEPFSDGDLPFVAAGTQTRTLTEGDGDEVAEGDEVEVQYLAVNGTSGDELVSTFPNDESVTLALGNEALFPAFREGLPGTAVGDELLMAIPASEAFGEAGNPQLGVGPTDTVLFYLAVQNTWEPLTEAQGEEVEPEEGLPTVTMGDAGPEIDVEGVEAPEQLVTQPLIQGERPEVVAGQTIRVHYTGVKLSDGEQFDSSWERGEPTEFPIGVGQVIAGWDEGLVGQPVGSRVLLVVPAEEAYGELPEETEGQTAAPAHELAGEDLVFVVDILGAS